MKALRRLMLALLAAAVLLPLAAQSPKPEAPRRRITPVNNAATRTQHVNETRNDTARINAQRRARSTSYTDDKGSIVFVDTLTGEQWVDSSLIARVPRMTKPLIYSGSIGVNIWDPVMRIFGQHYGLIDAWVQLNMHNRYLPVFELGVGQTDHRPVTGNYTFHVPASVYFRLGADYNFFYNSNPDYLLLAGLRYGFSPFRYGVRDIVLDTDYWHETATFDIPLRSATAGWLELRLGVRVKIWGPISMGWYFKYSKMLHESKNTAGQPSYVPGFGTRGPGIGGSFSIIYTIPLTHLNKSKATEVVNADKTSEE
ncbi:MAG: hypothetical protein K2M06_02690 [Muribaculaceae bacterium]|nr:hypothetical protein [Muribaculaceae bacterium]